MAAAIQSATYNKAASALPPTDITAGSFSAFTGIEMVRRLTPDECKTLEETMASKYNKKQIDALLETVRAGGWGELSECLTKHPDMPYYALWAFCSGDLTDQQFGSLLLYWSVMQGPKDALMYPMMGKDEGKFEEGRQLLKKYLQGDNPMQLTDEQFDLFIEELKNQPISEQQFFLLRNEFNSSSSASTALQREGFPFTRFCFAFAYADTLIPTIGLMQAYVRAKSGKNAVTIRPVLGLSKVEDIRSNALNGQRDCAFHFPGVHLPRSVHKGVDAPFHQFTLHDLYHVVVASRFPDWFRREIIHLSDIIRSMQKTKSKADPEYRLLGVCAARLIDMELLHMEKADDHISDAFWETILMRGGVRPVLEAPSGDEVMSRFCHHLIETKSQINTGPELDPNSEVHRLHYYICDGERVKKIAAIWQKTKAGVAR